MRAPLVILIVIVVGILIFLLIYSQQHTMPAPSAQGPGTAGVYGSEPASGSYGSALWVGGCDFASVAGGYDV